MNNQAAKSKAKLVATYTRRSSKRPQLSLARQMAVIHRYAKRRGLETVGAYSDGVKGGGKP